MDTAKQMRFMKLALTLARRGYGSTSPNPMVGAVLVQGGQIKDGVILIGKTTVKLDVRDQTGTLLKTVSASVYAGDQINLGADIGLSVSFGQGNLTV